jgi:hypothetical protein
MKKVALLVTAEVKTRIVLDMPDDFNEETDAIPMEYLHKTADVACPRLAQNVKDFGLDCLVDIDVDTECPYDAEYDKEWD